MVQSISWLSLSWCFIPVILVVSIFLIWQSKPTEVLVASARMILQLITIGYVLVFLFDNPSPWTSLLVLCVMLIATAWIAVRPVRKQAGFLLPALLALLLSVALHLALSLFLVLDVDSWYEPRILIPLAGMYLANAMNAVSLAAERYFSGLQDKLEDTEARIKAYHAAMIPQINGLLAVGLVTLPGMMTGQILSGVSPLIAVRYQILIMTMILGSSGLAAAIMLWKLGRNSSCRDSLPQ